MDITHIYNSIKSFFDFIRNPAQEVPSELIAMEGTQKPGVSTIISTGNIVSKLNEHGIPTDPLPDGTENNTVTLVIAILDEVYRALREDANIQVAYKPGAISVITNGSNSAGPVLSKGVNNNFTKGCAIIQ